MGYKTEAHHVTNFSCHYDQLPEKKKLKRWFIMVGKCGDGWSPKVFAPSSGYQEEEPGS